MAARLVRLRQNYQLDLGKEKAQTGLWFLSASGNTLADFETVITPLIDDLWSLQRSLHSSKTSHLGSNVDEVNIVTGHQIQSIAIAAPTNPDGNGSATTMPCEVAEVLTLRTPFTSARQRGRIYLPPASVSALTADGLLDNAARNSVVDAYAAFFQAVYDDSGDWVPVVYSRVDTAATPLTACDMGNVYDVQRSRRRSLVEVRYRAAFG